MRQFPLVTVFLGLASAAAWACEPATVEPVAISFPLDLAIIDPDAKDELPPFLIMFPKGNDKDGRDVRGPLGRLEALRGPSKMFPDSNKDDGLPVVLRGLRLHRAVRVDGSSDYAIELQGEFNSIKVPLAAEEAARFLAGERATFALKGQKNYGLYSYVSTTRIEIELAGDEVFIRKLEGDFTFREGLYTYVSQTLKLESARGKDYLYRGKRMELPVLPSL